MKSNVKIKRALIDTPGIKTYNHGEVVYTPEFLEKISGQINDQIVELDVHNSGEYGKLVNMGFCPTHGLWADLLVPADAPEDDIKFSTHFTEAKYETTEDGKRAIADAKLIKVVWNTPDGPNVRNPNTQLCNTEDDTIVPEPEDVGALNVQIGQLQNQLTAEQTKVQQLEQENADLKQKLQDEKDSKATLDTELQEYKKTENESKATLLEDIAGDNEILKKAYSGLSIKELQDLKASIAEQNQTIDTPPKGAKNKTVPAGNPPKKKEKDKEEPTYEDLVKARKERGF